MNKQLETHEILFKKLYRFLKFNIKILIFFKFYLYFLKIGKKIIFF